MPLLYQTNDKILSDKAVHLFLGFILSWRSYQSLYVSEP